MKINNSLPQIFKQILFQYLLSFFLVLFFTAAILPQSISNGFEHISIEKGLSAPGVSCMLQDRKGFLWLGTFLWYGMSGGVDRFDGYNFVPYGDKGSLDYPQTMLEDKDGNIWVGTISGLIKIDPLTGKVISYKPHPPVPGNEWSNNVLSIYEDKKGFLWVGTFDGLNIFDKVSNKFISCLRHNDNDPGSLVQNSINAIYEDKSGTLWLGTGGGLEKYDFITGKFIHFWKNPAGVNYLINRWNDSEYWVQTIFEDRSGMFWLGTSGGLVKFDIRNGSYQLYKGTWYKAKNMTSGYVNTIYEDDNGLLWIGTQSGLNIFDKKTETFSHYWHDQLDPTSLSANTIQAIFKERSGTLWIATQSGLDKINLSKPLFKTYKLDIKNNEKVRTTQINQLESIEDGKVLMYCTFGWSVFDPNSETITQYPLHPPVNYVYHDKAGNLWCCGEINKKGIIYKKDIKGNVTRYYDSSGKLFNEIVISISESTKDGLWLGTYENGNGGIYFLDFKSHIISLRKHTNVEAVCIHEDKSGLVWAGTVGGGLVCYDPDNNSTAIYVNNSNDSLSISSNTIETIFEEKSGTIWFDRDRFNRSNSTFTHLSEKDGFTSSAVISILGDDNGNIWLNTPKGISKFNPVTKKVWNYDESHGFQGIRFLPEVSCKTKNGEMYFGGLNGFTRFHPDSIRDNPFVPPIVITSFRKFDKQSAFGKEIDLSYNENYISFEFAALSYIHPGQNKYAYKLEGIDKDWVYSGNRRYASYPDLDPGKYTFRVKGSNNDGIWNEAGTSILIIISPPWWKTLWAYAIYLGLFISGLFAIRKYEMNRLNWKNKVKLDEAILVEKEETEKMKSRFFANISHEFRTPLTLIQGPVENIISISDNKKILKNAGLIKRNSSRLLQLINQLLDLSKLEAGKLKLEASEGNIVSFVKGVALSFESLFESKDITFKFQANKQAIELYFDREKMLKIITNLISNAFKFTPEKGKITISVNKIINDAKPGIVQIKIRDTGIGISQEEIPKLFDRFYQVDSSFTKEYEGAGIGLALTKELIELHKGHISVTSRPADKTLNHEGWTEFTVELRLGRGHLDDEQIISNEEKNGELKNPEEDHLFLNVLNDEPEKEYEEDRNIILVVEDNYDMREFIKDSLSHEYLIEEAVNGERGLKRAEEIIPDLIIADVMMPKMDGNLLSRFIKNNEKTSHIPVILLTARSGYDDKIEGLESGADDYLTKPFDIKELQVRIKNLILIRKRLQDKFSKMEHVQPDIKIQTKEKILNIIDEKFISKVEEIIEKHISEEEFSSEDFVNDIGMSRMQVHRKLKALTGKSLTRYIRSVKLEKARIMIEEKKGNISEIAYSLGFSSPAYFTRCFREEFGYPPSEIIN